MFHQHWAFFVSMTSRCMAMRMNGAYTCLHVWFLVLRQFKNQGCQQIFRKHTPVKISTQKKKKNIYVHAIASFLGVSNTYKVQYQRQRAKREQGRNKMVMLSFRSKNYTSWEHGGGLVRWCMRECIIQDPDYSQL